MKRFGGGLLLLVVVCVMAAGSQAAFAQARFKIPYVLKIGTMSLPKGEYTVSPGDSTHITFRQQTTGKEFQIPFTKRLAKPTPPLADPQLVVDAVGNFAPSYTEYLTDYVLAEVWLPGAEGYLVHEMKGAHKSETLKGERAK